MPSLAGDNSARSGSSSKLIHFCDAIEHNGIIYAIDKADGTTYCWDGACKLFSSDVNYNAMILFELFVMIGISLFEQNLSRTMEMY